MISPCLRFGPPAVGACMRKCSLACCMCLMRSGACAHPMPPHHIHEHHTIYVATTVGYKLNQAAPGAPRPGLGWRLPRRAAAPPLAAQRLWPAAAPACAHRRCHRCCCTLSRPPHHPSPPAAGRRRTSAGYRAGNSCRMQRSRATSSAVARCELQCVRERALHAGKCTPHAGLASAKRRAAACHAGLTPISSTSESLATPSALPCRPSPSSSLSDITMACSLRLAPASLPPLARGGGESLPLLPLSPALS